MDDLFQHYGTISHGTMRDEDLLPLFLDVLEVYAPDVAHALRHDYADALEHLSTGLEPNPDDLDGLREALYDHLDRVAPEGYTFGSTEGDGSDFGFWAVEDDEMPDCHLPRWINPDTLVCEHTDHDAPKETP